MTKITAYNNRNELAKPLVSIVIPAYNEERQIGATLDTVMAYFESQPYSWEVIVADDGSTDGTAAILMDRAHKDERFKVASLPHRGKGFAVKHGMLQSQGRYRLMCDADLSVSIEYLGKFLAKMREKFDIIIASREKQGARRICEPAFRHLRGRVFNLAIRLLAIPTLSDTQCGFKCFEEEAAQTLFALQRTNGFGFDVEILYLARKLGYRIAEEPVDWYHREASTVRLLVDWFVMLMDVTMIRLRDLTGRYQV